MVDIRFFLSGVDLAEVPVTQNGYGKYYYDSAKGYWRTTINKFDTATPPSPYKTYTNGSHKYCQIIAPVYNPPYVPPNNLLQLAYDFEDEPFAPFTADKQVEIIAHADNGMIKFRRKDYYFWVGHFDMRTAPPVGTFVEPGKLIAKLRQSDSHLHIYSIYNGKQYPIKDIILNGYDYMKNGDKLKYTLNTNLRSKPSSSSQKVALIQPGAIGIVADGPVSANGQTWYFLKFRDISGWTIPGEKTTEDTTNVNGRVYIDYEKQYNEAMIEIEKLKDRNTVLATKIVEMQKKINELQVIVDDNQEVVDGLNGQIVAKDKRIARLESQLKTCQEGANDALKAAFAWFTKTINTLWASFLEWLKGFKEED